MAETPPPRVLTEAELRQVVGIDRPALAAIESAFGWIVDGRVNMPPIMHIAAGERGDVDVKSAFVDGLPYFAIKIAAGFYGNPERGLPAGSAMMVLLNAETGFCEAVLLDNSFLTDLRTELAGAVAGKCLAPSAVETVGVIGTETQARYQVQCLRLVRADWLHRGQHVTAVGADFPGKQELEAAVFAKADRIGCDRLSQCLANGELQHVAVDGRLPDGLEIAELGQLTTGSKQGRQRDDEIAVCDLTGTGVQDTAIANLAYAEAVKRGFGTTA